MRLQVRQIMTKKVVTISDHQSLPLASALMIARGIHHLPVVDGDGALIGLVSHRDILSAEISAAQTMPNEDRDAIESTVPISRFMTRGICSVSPETPALEAVERMLNERLGCLPVVDRDGRLCGIVTERDALRLAIRWFATRGVQVGSLMTRGLVTAGPDSSVNKAKSQMEEEGIRHLPIVDAEGTLLGITSERDLLAYQRSTIHRELDGAPDIKLSEFCSVPVWSIRGDIPASEAAQVLWDNRFGCLPVVEDKHLLGILTLTDLLRFLVSQKSVESVESKLDVPANYYMSKCVGVSEDDQVEQVLLLCQKFQTSTLVVLDGEETAIGVISLSDIWRASTMGTPSSIENVKELWARPVAELMTQGFVAVGPDTGIAAVAETLVQQQIHQAVVVSEGRVRGLIGVDEILRAVRDLRVPETLTECMSPVLFSIDVAETLGDALRYLDRAGVPGVIVRDGDFPVGVFGYAEALRALGEPHETPIEHLMSCQIMSSPAQIPAFRAAAQAAALKVHQILVVAADGSIGVVTGSDFAARLARMAAALCILVLVTVSACKSKESPEDPPPPPPAPVSLTPAQPPSDGATPAPVATDSDLMQEHFSHASLAKNFILQGEMDKAAESFKWLAKRGALSGSPDSWQPHTRRLQAMAKEALRDPGLDNMTMRLAEVARECGACHAGLGVEAKLVSSEKPPTGHSFETHMRAHKWALDRMWAGLSTPSDALWQEGAGLIAEAPSHLRNLSGYGDNAGEAVDLASGVHAMAQEALKEKAPDKRAILFGRFLALCVSCHELPGSKTVK